MCVSWGIEHHPQSPIFNSSIGHNSELALLTEEFHFCLMIFQKYENHCTQVSLHIMQRKGTPKAVQELYNAMCGYRENRREIKTSDEKEQIPGKWKGI